MTLDQVKDSTDFWQLLSMEPNKMEVWIKAVINWLLVLLPTGQEETSFFILWKLDGDRKNAQGDNMR